MADNIDELHRKIKDLEGEVAYLNAQLKQDNRFGLHWIDVPEAFEAGGENAIPILEEVPELSITKDDGKPTHILIEGDNYHALTCLNYTHQGKVDVIYIDPPYNTGSDGFTYKDKRFPSNPQPIGFSGILLAKRQNSFYCTYFLHNRNVADTKSPYPIKRLEVIRWFNQKSMVFNQSLS